MLSRFVTKAIFTLFITSNTLLRAADTAGRTALVWQENQEQPY